MEVLLMIGSTYNFFEKSWKKEEDVKACAIKNEQFWFHNMFDELPDEIFKLREV